MIQSAGLPNPLQERFVPGLFIRLSWLWAWVCPCSYQRRNCAPSLLLGARHLVRDGSTACCCCPPALASGHQNVLLAWGEIPVARLRPLQTAWSGARVVHPLAAQTVEDGLRIRGETRRGGKSRGAARCCERKRDDLQKGHPCGDETACCRMRDDRCEGGRASRLSQSVVRPRLDRDLALSPMIDLAWGETAGRQSADRRCEADRDDLLLRGADWRTVYRQKGDLNWDGPQRGDWHRDDLGCFDLGWVDLNWDHRGQRDRAPGGLSWNGRPRVGMACLRLRSLRCGGGRVFHPMGDRPSVRRAVFPSAVQGSPRYRCDLAYEALWG